MLKIIDVEREKEHSIIEYKGVCFSSNGYPQFFIHSTDVEFIHITEDGEFNVINNIDTEIWEDVFKKLGYDKREDEITDIRYLRNFDIIIKE